MQQHYTIIVTACIVIGDLSRTVCDNCFSKNQPGKGGKMGTAFTKMLCPTQPKNAAYIILIHSCQKVKGQHLLLPFFFSLFKKKFGIYYLYMIYSLFGIHYLIHDLFSLWFCFLRLPAMLMNYHFY